ncbi:MAG: hypothetical protein ICV85_09290 [Tolypothrix sp. T3-bin4]|nr:hypothetical protein [Tolypothrix sp. Co-bin9]MBD0302356.1 hypothetical protein [Tolypothrix sp. T3-bin4]
MVKLKKVESVKDKFYSKALKNLLVGSFTNYKLCLVILTTTMLGGIFLESVIPGLLLPAQALSWEWIQDGEKKLVKFGVGDGVVPKTRALKALVGTHFNIVSKHNGSAETFYIILRNGEELERISQAIGSESKVFQVASGRNNYTIVDSQSKTIVDEFTIRGI